MEKTPQHLLDKWRREAEEERAAFNELDDLAAEREHKSRVSHNKKNNHNTETKPNYTYEETNTEKEQRRYIDAKTENYEIDRFNDAVERCT